MILIDIINSMVAKTKHVGGYAMVNAHEKVAVLALQILKTVLLFQLCLIKTLCQNIWINYIIMPQFVGYDCYLKKVFYLNDLVTLIMFEYSTILFLQCQECTFLWICRLWYSICISFCINIISQKTNLISM